MPKTFLDRIREEERKLIQDYAHDFRDIAIDEVTLEELLERFSSELKDIELKVEDEMREEKLVV